MKTVWIALTLIVYLLGLVYLSLPNPLVASFPGAYRSIEEGDTVQHPDQPGYYTDATRAEVLKYYQDTFSLKFAGISLPSFRLNYRPEDSTQYVREQLLTYYLEEIVHPFRESLFVNGWNPRLSPISASLFPYQFDRWAMIREGREYQSKVTLRPYYSSPLIRYFVWTAIFPLTYLVFTQFFRQIHQLRNILTTK